MNEKLFRLNSLFTPIYLSIISKYFCLLRLFRNVDIESFFNEQKVYLEFFHNQLTLQVQLFNWFLVERNQKFKTATTAADPIICIFSKRVVCDEPVVGVEGDEKGGEAGYREDVEDPRVLDNKTGSVLINTKLSLALPSMVEGSL